MIAPNCMRGSIPPEIILFAPLVRSQDRPAAMASLSSNTDMAMTNVIDKTKAVALTYLSADPPPSSVGGGTPLPIPLWNTMEDSALVKNLPGSWVKTLAGEVRFVPLSNAVGERSGGLLFSTIRTTPSGAPQIFKTRADAEDFFLSDAVLGVASDDSAKGINVDKLVTADGTPAALSFAESRDATPVVNLKIGNGPTETVALQQALETLNISWGNVSSQDTEPLPTKGALETLIVPMGALGDEFGVLSQLLLDTREGLSAYTLGSLVAGLSNVNFSQRDVRKLGAAFAAAAQQSGATARPATRRSMGAPAPTVDRHKAKFGKALMKLIKEFCDSISPAQISRLTVETEEAAQSQGASNWRRSLAACASALGAKAHAIWSSDVGVGATSSTGEAEHGERPGDAPDHSPCSGTPTQQLASGAAGVEGGMGAVPSEDAAVVGASEAPPAGGNLQLAPLEGAVAPTSSRQPAAVARSPCAATGPALVSSNTRSRRAIAADPPAAAGGARGPGSPSGAAGASRRDSPSAQPGGRDQPLSNSRAPHPRGAGLVPAAASPGSPEPAQGAPSNARRYRVTRHNVSCGRVSGLGTWTPDYSPTPGSPYSPCPGSPTQQPAIDCASSHNGAHVPSALGELLPGPLMLPQAVVQASAREPQSNSARVVACPSARAAAPPPSGSGAAAPLERQDRHSSAPSAISAQPPPSSRSSTAAGRARQVLRQGAGSRGGLQPPPALQSAEIAESRSPSGTPPASPVASGRNRRGAASPSSGARSRPLSPRPARAPSPSRGGRAPSAAASRSRPPVSRVLEHQPPDITAFVACAPAESSDDVLDQRIAQLQQELEAAARARALSAASAAGRGEAGFQSGQLRPQGPLLPARSRSVPRAATRFQPPPPAAVVPGPPPTVVAHGPLDEATLANEPVPDTGAGAAHGRLRPILAEMGGGEALAPLDGESGPAAHGAGVGLHRVHAFQDQRCFVGLVPADELASSKQRVLSCLSRALGVADGTIAKALREVARPAAASRATQLLIMEGSVQEAEAADKDYRQIVTNCGDQLPASAFADPPSSWEEGTHRLHHALQLAEGLLNGARGDAGAQAPASAAQPADDKRSHRRRLPSVARTSDQAKWATPARHIDKLDTQEIFEAEVAALASRHSRDIWEEAQRIVLRYGGLGWSAVFSNSHVIEKSANDCRVILTFPASSEGLYEKVYDYIVETCVGPSYRFKDELDKDVRRVCDGVIHGDFSLESIVRALGAIPSSEECTEAGRVAGDPNMGRAGRTSGPELQTDMPRALARFGDLLLMVHHFAGDSPPPPPGGLGLLELWYASAILPLESTKMPDKITEIVGQKRLQEVALSSISRAMQERRRSASDQPIDFAAIVREVHAHEFKLARERQMQYSFAMAVSGKRDRDSDTRDQKADRPQQQSRKEQKTQPPKGDRLGGKRHQRPSSDAEPPAKRDASQSGGAAPRREPWMTFKPNSISYVVGPKSGPNVKPNVICAFEQLCVEAAPNAAHHERPCAWASLLKKGCSKSDCRRCQHQQALTSAGKPGNPIPNGALAKVKAACTAQVAELLK